MLSWKSRSDSGMMKNIGIVSNLFTMFAVVLVLLNPTNAMSDMERGLKNYQAIISGEKKSKDLTPEELQEVITIHSIFKRQAAGGGDGCDNAYSRCVKSCESETNYFDYDTSNYRELYNTDYASNCSDACRRGRKYCEDEDVDERCYEFKRKCRNSCPSDVFDYSSGEYKFLTDVDSLCEDSCRAGERACE